MKGRQMVDIIRNIDIYSDELKNIGGYLVVLDQEKAFDRVKHQYLKLHKKLNIKGHFFCANKKPLQEYNEIRFRLMVP